MTELVKPTTPTQRSDSAQAPARPHVVLVVPRGEAVRNFLYSDTLRVLSEKARVTLLSVLDAPDFVDQFRLQVEQILPLKLHRERWLVRQLRSILHDVHFRWLWSEVAKNVWEIRDAMAVTILQKLKRGLVKALTVPLANRPALEALTEVERYLTWALRPDNHFVDLFKRLAPDLVFNCSHIHGQAGELPVKVAHRLGIPTAGFIFSWDNLTSRSRIFAPYDYYLVWHKGMRDQLLEIYPKIDPARVVITGTPQFDFHFKQAFHLSREELAQRIGIDPARPYVLYTTGIAKHFPEEHRTVERVIEILREMPERPQLVVRTYVKGTSDEMRALAARQHPDVVFPPVQWDDRWFMPRYEDLSIYTSLLRHAALGINAASTVSLELMMFDKPVVNLGFDPPGSRLPRHVRWIRHVEFDHYRPVAESGAVMVARSMDDLRAMILRGLQEPERDRAPRKRFLQEMFDHTLDGGSGRRVAEALLDLARTYVASR